MENTKEKAEYWGIIEDTIEEIKSIYENSLYAIEEVKLIYENGLYTIEEVKSIYENGLYKAYKLGFQHGKNDERQRDINYFVLDNS